MQNQSERTITTVGRDLTLAVESSLKKKEENPMTETATKNDQKVVQPEEARPTGIFHSIEGIFDLMPERHRCDCCGKHVSELIPFGGFGDPLLHDYTGRLLVKRYRPMFDARKEYAALKEAETNYQKDGMRTPGEWLIKKYGREEAERIVESGMCDGADKSWECRDCMLLSNGAFFDMLKRNPWSHEASDQREPGTNSPSFPTDRILPMHETNFLKVVLAEDKITSLLNEIGIGGVTDLNKIGESRHSYNRKSVKYECRMQNQETKKNLVIDITSSEPSGEQLQNVVYELGADCDERIVVFAFFENRQSEEGRSDEIIKELILDMNQHGLNITMVRVNISETHFWNEVLISSDQCRKDSSPELPSKEEFCKIAFWETFLADGDGRDVSYFYGPLDEKRPEETCLLGSIFLVIDWTEEGARLSLKAEEKTGRYVKRLWDAKQSEIEAASKGFEVDFMENSDGENPMINITLFRTPVSVLTIASVEEKKAYTDLFRATFRRFYRLMVTWSKELYQEGE
jgi:hypothetical protein